MKHTLKLLLVSLFVLSSSGCSDSTTTTQSSQGVMGGSITQSKMKELVYLYETFQNAGENEKRKPSDIEELKQFSRGLDRNFSPFTAYNPLTKRTIDALYLPPKNEEDDELIFIYEEPILAVRIEKETYTEEEMEKARYIAFYSQSGIKHLKEKPEELNQSQPVERVND